MSPQSRGYLLFLTPIIDNESWRGEHNYWRVYRRILLMIFWQGSFSEGKGNCFLKAPLTKLSFRSPGQLSLIGGDLKLIVEEK